MVNVKQATRYRADIATYW